MSSRSSSSTHLRLRRPRGVAVPGFACARTRAIAINEGSNRLHKGAVRCLQARPLALGLHNQLGMRQYIELEKYFRGE